MHFPRFWALGRSGGFSSWRWSDTGAADAEAKAREAAIQLEQKFQQDGFSENRYGYADRPLREPVLEEIRDSHGEVSAVVTRNSFGCRVLNTARAMFVDVDLPEPKSQGMGSFLSGLFGTKAAPADELEGVLAKAGDWVKRYPDWSWRVYRTAGGARLMATHALFEPAEPICEQVFAATGADPLYRRLCRSQLSFRARLTPKPWRCQQPRPYFPWPFANAVIERRFEQWEAAYRNACAGKATCALVTTVGSGRIHEEIRPLIRLHDDLTAATSGLPLA